VGHGRQTPFVGSCAVSRFSFLCLGRTSARRTCGPLLFMMVLEFLATDGMLKLA
jgi:hypothetical protein